MDQQSIGTMRSHLRPIDRNGHLALLPYRDPFVHHCIRALKYEKHRKSIRLAADLLGEFLQKRCLEIDSSSDTRYVLCVIPTTETRKLRDGYDHLHLLAQSLLETPFGHRLVYDRQVLSWCRPVSRQSTLRDRRERKENVQGALSVRSDILTDLSWIILDDVVTTGATLSEARRALYACGVPFVLSAALRINRLIRIYTLRGSPESNPLSVFPKKRNTGLVYLSWKKCQPLFPYP